MRSINNLTVKVFRDKSSFLSLQKDWETLASESNQTVFMSYSWICSWWDIFGDNPNRKLFIHCVYENNEMVAIFPFFTGKSSLLGKETQKRIQLLGSGGNRNESLGFSDSYGYNDFLDILVKPGFEEKVADFFFQLLDEDTFADYKLYLVNVSGESFIYNHLFPRFNSLNRSVNVEKSDTCPYIVLEGESDLASFIKNKDSGSVRRRLRQCLKAQKPETENGYQITEVTSRDGVEKAINHIIELHQSRWNMLGYTGVFFDKRFVAFFSKIVFDAFDNKSLWLKHAVDDNGVCASRMLIKYNNRYYDYISGFSDSSPSSKYRPGIALLLDLIEDAIKQGVSRVELLRGAESYKFDFTDKAFSNYSVLISENYKVKKKLEPLKSATRMLSFLYKHTNKEFQLMQVQYINHGLLKMPVSYAKFRAQRLKEKVYDDK